MNKVILMGRLTKDPEVGYLQNNQDMARATYSLAVDRRFTKAGEERKTDFINCVVFGKGAEFAGKYFHKGQKVLVEGRLQTNTWTDKDGKKQYGMNVVLDSQEFAESKGSKADGKEKAEEDSIMDGFMNIDSSIDDEELPFA